MKIQLSIFLLLIGTIAFGQNKIQKIGVNNSKFNFYYNKQSKEIIFSFDIHPIRTNKFKPNRMKWIKKLFIYKKWLDKNTVSQITNKLNSNKEKHVSKQCDLFGKYDVNLNIIRTKSLKITEVE